MAGLMFLLTALAAAVTAICTITYLWTTVQYHLTMRRNRDPANADARSPVVPYAIPWLGSSLAFLTPQPGRFYRDILAWHPPAPGHFGAVLAGEVNHIVFAPRAVQALFKVKSSVAHREHLTHDIFIHALSITPADYDVLAKGGPLAKMLRDEEMNQEYLLRQSAVNENTSNYISCLKANLASWAAGSGLGSAKNGADGVSLDLYAWLQERMFLPSVRAFLGERMEHMYPEFSADFWRFQDGILDLLFGIPRILQPEPYRVRDRLVANLTRWVEDGDKIMQEKGSKGPDPHDKSLGDWEPIWGSRLSRARQARWIKEGVTTGTRASLELGFLFGLGSNVIPVTGWILIHVLDPKKPDLLPRVLNEIRRAVIVPETSPDSGDGADDDDDDDDDGRDILRIEDISVDVNILVAQPLLQSLYMEALRMYVDVLVARKCEQDLRLPIDPEPSVENGNINSNDDNKSSMSKMLFVKKGETIITPNLVSQNDPSFFTNPPPHVFDPERFLVPASSVPSNADDQQQQQQSWQDEYAFSTTASSHKLWPYGGGKTICPGRVFAKQEILATVAGTLLAFDIEPEDPATYKVPGYGRVYGGSGTIPPINDVRVRIRRRRW